MLAFVLTCGGPPAFAHDGPEHDIEELTERMEKEGESADLLLQRAVEYNILSRTTNAVNDLERALQLEPNSASIQRELSRSYFVLGRTNDAFDTATRALNVAGRGPERGSVLITRAEFLRAHGDARKALDDANAAIREQPDNCEWYLFRSQLHELLKLHDERVKGLTAGIKETGSGLLDAELVDALIDAGKIDEAVAKIEAEFKSSRSKSSWLIRRAKAHIAAKKSADARVDLLAAVDELNRRIAGPAPDPLLLADRGMAHELLGNNEAARNDYDQARQKGMADEWLRDRLRTLSRTNETTTAIDGGSAGEKTGK